MAAPAFGSVGTRLGSTTAAPAVAVPAGVAANDIIVVVIWVVGTITVTGRPAGFAAAENSPAATGSPTSTSFHVEWKRATGADSGTYAFTLSASNFVYARAFRYTGCVTSGSPWDTPTAEADSAGASPATMPAVSVITAGPDRMLIYVAGTGDGDVRTWAGPAGFTLRESGVSATNFELADSTQAAAGTSGTVQGSVTVDPATASASWLGALIGTTVANPPQVSPVQVRSANTYGSTATETGATVPLPAGWQPGDLCYIGWILLSAATVLGPIPTGWTEIVPNRFSYQNSNTLFGCVRRILQSGDSNPAFTFTSGRFAAISVAITGYLERAPEDTAVTVDVGEIDTFPDVRIPSITSITKDALMIAFAASRNSTAGNPITWTPPAGMTEVAEVSTTVSTTVAIEACRLDLPSPTVTGVKIATPAATTFTGPAPVGISIVVSDASTPSFENMILCQENGHQLLQETRHHLLLES